MTLSYSSMDISQSVLCKNCPLKAPSRVWPTQAVGSTGSGFTSLHAHLHKLAACRAIAKPRRIHSRFPLAKHSPFPATYCPRSCVLVIELRGVLSLLGEEDHSRSHKL